MVMVLLWAMQLKVKSEKLKAKNQAVSFTNDL